jgi:hypothetical protein
MATAFPVLAQLRDSSPLKITRVEPYLVRIGDRTSYPLARVKTADGLYGWGEGTHHLARLQCSPTYASVAN